MRVVVLADTHVRHGSRRRLPDEAQRAVDDADLVLHAGDVVSGEFLDALAVSTPVHAVLCNNDHELVGVLPETRLLDLEGVRVAMIHDSGPSKGRAARLRRRFPDADVVVFGHSHIPIDEVGIDGQLLFNPGSPTERRRQPYRTFGVLDLRDGEIVRHEIVRVEPPAVPRK